MPELPEVETTIRSLNSKVIDRIFIDVWSDWKKTIKKPDCAGRPKDFEDFKKKIKGKKINKIWRRAKNIIFDLSGGYSLLAHQKMTGHLLIGNWKLEIGNWKPLNTGPLQDASNSYIHLMFWLSGGPMLALSDLRKFAKIELWKTNELLSSKEFKDLGPEPLEKDFTFEKFKQILKNKKAGKIKQILMDQSVIAGIGNIYSNEAMWRAKIHPQKDIAELSEKELKLLYQSVRKVLLLGIKLGGESFSDYRQPDGTKGCFDEERRVYQREGEKCSRCKAKIKRIKFGGRSSFFCPICQKL
ncbi:MAG: hypothetical protein CEN87_45 [Parcubacteria group bacterium Licking1014_1]|nr:MAG: hypothetical protein CEN87_45 [Parcubacteria group bacterium Licking1014_1]